MFLLSKYGAIWQNLKLTLFGQEFKIDYYKGQWKRLDDKFSYILHFSGKSITLLRNELFFNQINSMYTLVYQQESDRVSASGIQLTYLA